MERLKLEFYYGQEAEQFTFYRLPKALITDNRFKDISNNSKLLYGLMLDRMSLSVRSGWFDDQNRVYIKYSLKSIMEDLNCSKMTAVGLLKELQAIGLSVPQITRVCTALRAHGVPLSEDIYTVEEAKRQLLALLRKKEAQETC